MPNYTYKCHACNKKFNLFLEFKHYDDRPKCSLCKSQKTERSYEDDLPTISASIKKSDGELKSIGDLANRNRDRMTEDHKQSLGLKHNEYKDTEIEVELPKGMQKIKKPKKKLKWT